MIRTTTMKFVDIQPNLSLDYAWTSPSRSPAVMNITKPSKTSRKQNRCCDQCRKGKRACDAAILEDTLLDDGKSEEKPATFHYSDVFGALAACGNCEKTKKKCTFEWLKSQRIAQSTQAQASPVPPSKRRRTSSEKSERRREAQVDIKDDAASSNTPFDADLGADFGDFDLGVTFADFAGGPTAFDLDPSNLILQDISTFSQEFGITPVEMQAKNTIGDNTLYQHDSGPRSAPETTSGTFEDDAIRYTPETAVTTTKHNKFALRHNRKRSRRGSSVSVSNGALPCPASSFASRVVASTSNAMLTENLLRIYQNSFENALSCWVTERTCPSDANADNSLIENAGPNWNRIYHRVFRLDRIMAEIRKRQLTFNENTLASKALNLAIYAFATQWVQPSTNKNTKYPFNATEVSKKKTAGDRNMDITHPAPTFDRSVQVRTWNEAYMTLKSATGLESFRVALANIIFSLTQKPSQDQSERDPNNQAEQVQKEASSGNDEVDNCADLLSRLEIAIEADGQPIHLEAGLRQIHLLKSQVALQRPNLQPANLAAHSPRSAVGLALDSTDRATVDLLFRVSIMFDTLSAAINKRPLVVSDEDSGMYSDDVYSTSIRDANAEQLDVREMYANPRDRSQAAVVRWPCSFDVATKTLCHAAPVKVTLFRKITRLQTLITRGSQGVKMEACIKAALKICSHWEKNYAPFVQDCLHNHPQLHPRIQSWYICLAGHWHLATLLLSDTIEMIDEERIGLDAERHLRKSSNFLAAVRRVNSRTLAEIARCTCPRDDPLLPRFHDFRATLNQESLLSEPWTAILVRAFAKAGAILLDPRSGSASDEVLDQADDCVRALLHLGRKSDSALSAGKILGEALRIHRFGAKRTAADMNYLLDQSDIWHEFGDLAGEFGANCDI